MAISAVDEGTEDVCCAQARKQHPSANDIPHPPKTVLPCPACSETYEYYKLPYCKPKDGVKYKTLGMGEVVDANRMATTPYDLSFRKERTNQEVCTTKLGAEELKKFRRVGGWVAWLL